MHGADAIFWGTVTVRRAVAQTGGQLGGEGDRSSGSAAVERKGGSMSMQNAAFFALMVPMQDGVTEVVEVRRQWMWRKWMWRQWMVDAVDAVDWPPALVMRALHSCIPLAIDGASLL